MSSTIPITRSIKARLIASRIGWAALASPISKISTKICYMSAWCSALDFLGILNYYYLNNIIKKYYYLYILSLSDELESNQPVRKQLCAPSVTSKVILAQHCTKSISTVAPLITVAQGFQSQQCHLWIRESEVSGYVPIKTTNLQMIKALPYWAWRNHRLIQKFLPLQICRDLLTPANSWLGLGQTPRHSCVYYFTTQDTLVSTKLGQTNCFSTTRWTTINLSIK